MIICLVLWATREDDFGVILRKAFRSFVLLTLAIIIGCGILFVLGHTL
jgi:hypothetical protein